MAQIDPVPFIVFAVVLLLFTVWALIVRRMKP
jgi:hypothetical protein